MKIAIFSLPQNWNYGGILQSFALKSVLQSRGHRVTIICRRASQSPLKRVIAWLKWHSLPWLWKISQKTAWSKLVAVEKFKQRCLSESTSPFFRENSLKHFFRRQKFDAVIVGSDQIWRFHAAPSIPNAFLNFLADDHDIRKIAYAASFGVDHLDYPAKVLEECRFLATLFSAISVREKSGVQICRRDIGCDAIQLADPTMLLSAQDYDAACGVTKQDGNDPKLFCYFLDSSPEKTSTMQIVADAMKLTIHNFLSPAHSQKDYSVENWIRSFRKASAVMTDSFHGTVFSLIYHRPFVVFCNSERGAERFFTLLSDFGLTDRLIDTPDNALGKLQQEIDWAHIDEIIQQKQTQAFRFLQENLR